MALDPDPYEVLGVPRDAGEDQIARARRRLSREYHPDLNPAPDAAARFDAVQQAYQRLTGARPPDDQARGERGGARAARDPGDFAPRPPRPPRPPAAGEGSGPALPEHLKVWLLVIVLALIFLVYLLFTTR